MEPLICPECGGKIDELEAGSGLAVCPYCSTKFVLPPPSPFTDAAPVIAATVQAAKPTVAAKVDVSSKEDSPLRRAAGILIGAVSVTALLIDLFMPTQKNTRTGINFAQNTANSANSTANSVNAAKTAANSMKAMANLLAEMANRANANANTASPVPRQSKKHER